MALAPAQVPMSPGRRYFATEIDIQQIRATLWRELPLVSRRAYHPDTEWSCIAGHFRKAVVCWAAETGAVRSAMCARHAAMRDLLASNPFNRPLVLESSQTANDVKGDIFAVVSYPFDKVSAALAAPQGWCEILILHLNTKYCRIAVGKSVTSLLMNVGKKIEQPLDETFRLAFAWQLTDQTADYLRVVLGAASGPMGTHDYRILLEAAPLKDGTTFLRLSYSYGFGLSGKLAMLAYLGTVGRNKVGFSTLGTGPDGQPAYIDGMRGQQERNTMRYYLAIESFLGAPATAEGAPFERRINDWFTAVEHYPRQLHELERADYLAMKRNEYARQRRVEKAAVPGQG